MISGVTGIGPATAAGEEPGQHVVHGTCRKAGRHGGGQVFEGRQARERLRVEDGDIDDEADRKSEEPDGVEARAEAVRSVFLRPVQAAHVELLATQEEVIGDADAGECGVQRRGPYQEDEEAVVHLRVEDHEPERDEAEEEQDRAPGNRAHRRRTDLPEADNGRVEDVRHRGHVGESDKEQRHDADHRAGDLRHPDGRIAFTERNRRKQTNDFAKCSRTEDAENVWPEGGALALRQPRQVADIGPPREAGGEIDLDRDDEVQRLVLEGRRERGKCQKLADRMVAEDEVEHRHHQQHQRRRNDHVEELDRGRPLGDDEPGEKDGANGGDDHLGAGRVGRFVGAERHQAVNRAAEHHGKDGEPTHGQHDHGKHIDDAAAVVAELAAQRDELLDTVAARHGCRGERGQNDADDVADDDGGDALLRPDEKTDGAADQKGPGGNRQRGVGIGELPKAPEPFGWQQRRIAALGGGAVARRLCLFGFDGCQPAQCNVIGHLTPPEPEADNQQQRQHGHAGVVELGHPALEAVSSLDVLIDAGAPRQFALPGDIVVFHCRSPFRVAPFGVFPAKTVAAPSAADLRERANPLPATEPARARNRRAAGRSSATSCRFRQRAAHGRQSPPSARTRRRRV